MLRLFRGGPTLPQGPASKFRALIVLAALALAACVPSDYPAWRFAHASGANTGLVLVTTAPAAAGSISVPNIGTFAAGAGPVIASDGTLYIGNEQGRMMAFRENGAPIWNVMVSGGEPIVGSPLITSGAVFVTAATATSAALYKFDADGRELFRSPFPIHRDLIATTTPNVLSWAGDVIVAPATYRLRAAAVFETRVIAFAAGSGQIVRDQLINIFTPTTTGGVEGIPGILDNPPLKLPLPMAATYTDLTDGQARLIVADGYQAAVSYKVVNGGLVEFRRFTDTSAFRSFTSTPTVMYDRNSGRYRGFLVNRSNGLMWADDPIGPAAGGTTPDIHTASSITTTASANLAVWNNELVVLRAGETKRIALAGNSAASVAASLNYFYVSSVDAFTTFSIVGQQQAARFDWVGGGLHPPAIGPKGHVYAIASNILFIFPPPAATAMMMGAPLVQEALEPPRSAAPEK
jgi:hypothetical protein